MPHLDVIAFFLFCVLGFLILSFRDNVTTRYDVYTDRYGDDDLISMEDFVRKTTDWWIAAKPKFGSKSAFIDPGFALEKRGPHRNWTMPSARSQNNLFTPCRPHGPTVSKINIPC
jgi:hypothetical protein